MLEGEATSPLPSATPPRLKLQLALVGLLGQLRARLYSVLALARASPWCHGVQESGATPWARPVSRPISSSQEPSHCPPSFGALAGSAPPPTSRRLPPWPGAPNAQGVVGEGGFATPCSKTHSGWRACARPGAGSRMSASRWPRPAPPRARSALCAPCSVP